MSLAAEIAVQLNRSGLRATHPYTFRNPQKRFDRYMKDGYRYVLSISAGDSQYSIAHLRLSYAHLDTLEIQRTAIAIEDALNARFVLSFIEGKPHNSTGWDILERA